MSHSNGWDRIKFRRITSDELVAPHAYWNSTHYFIPVKQMVLRLQRERNQRIVFVQTQRGRSALRGGAYNGPVRGHGPESHALAAG